LVAAIGKLEYAASGAAITVLVVAMSSDAASRYLLRHSLSWAASLCSLLMVWLGFVSSSIAFREKSHLSFAFLADRLPRKTRLVLEILADVSILAVLVLIVHAGLRLQSMQRYQILPGLGLSRRWISAAVIVGCLSMILTCMAALLQNLAAVVSDLGWHVKESDSL
jgi:TRAP-type C4-dicarboxylate transport system permease small subunit